jgi:flagellar basal body rod protein FlgB
MLSGILGRATLADPLKDSLDVSAQRTKTIADRVSRAALGGQNGFAMPSTSAEAAAGTGEPIDLEAEMVNLADEQLHFEATAKLLSKAYEQLRLSIRDR